MNPTPQQRKIPSREMLTSVGDDGSRVAIHPSDVRGRFMVARRLSALLLIAIYVLMPWIPINGHPALFFDLANLRFHLFGFTLAAQDLWLAFFVITGLGFTLFFATALFGRLWCGWACPQTIFLEHVYRRIERWLEGDAPARRQLDRAPWTATKLLRRGAKHAVFVVVSLLIAHVLLAYFVSLPREWEMITHAPTQHWGLFIFIIVATAVLYFNFAWFREQLCIIICPYGRLQSALIDDDSVVIGYDAGRGEPRGPRKADAPAGSQGDCIDCFRCVSVCPTGIDIRQGLQLECVACSACVDACDEVMDRIKRPRGLVRYDSLNGLAGGKTRFLRPRVLVYSALLVIGAIVATISVSKYQPASFTAVRMQGAPYYIDETAVRNQFLVRVINKSEETVSFRLQVKALSPTAPTLSTAGWDLPLEVGPNGEAVRPLVVTVSRDDYNGKVPLLIEVSSESGRAKMTRETEFVGPDPRLLKEDAS